MLTIRTAAHIRGARSLKGFRSCGVSTGVCDQRADVSRVFRAEAGLEASELRRRWLASRWEAHEARAARSRRHRGREITR
ncbi:MAG: hypothetical protein HYU51_19280 [Candidatus Rokubacteria bacterium]|nr:hypothetical protein [Candidatus Rokubacteria bacterium]